VRCAPEIKDTQSGAERELEVKCVFVAIGHTPNTAPFKGKLDMDENGYLLQREARKRTFRAFSQPGDVADHVYRQAITARARAAPQRWTQRNTWRCSG